MNAINNQPQPLILSAQAIEGRLPGLDPFIFGPTTRISIPKAMAS
ncbi:hypothetical protein [Diaphorobacter aerolatus]|nr:hypothetical protein [Diaphorobacter aerolatus]